ncbi:hypothetical protein SGM_2159 [Streptomyces griseoaurantiacus M045]|uniref:Uncharacterized protein n=3 Tax=Streptomyces griseoaurantiacus TaxID=68213 RepID=F3NG95_9ACTN|nr:hypothetical protein SGM_2159 [Streptomyces griseoaurantiacus M045]MCF0089709.1 hypothetical protein [Streptomyces sp. MH192]MCF0101790.1 hypothetical protein [Streptomyces sp. MH191]
MAHGKLGGSVVADTGERGTMPTAVLTDRQRTAVQAYVRLLHTVRAALDDPPGPDGGSARPPLVPPGVLAEAEQALAAAGLPGTDAEFFRLLSGWCAVLDPTGRGEAGHRSGDGG